MIRTGLITALILSGTMATANPLTGTWDCEGRKSRTEAVRTLLKFRANGQLKHQANFAAYKKGRRTDFSVTLHGNWKFQPQRMRNGKIGGVVWEKMSRTRVTGMKVNNFDLLKTPVGNVMKKVLPEVFTSGNRPFRSKIIFESPNRLKSLSGKTKMTCTRRR